MKTKLADYVINFLAEKGVDRIFEVYGSANGDLIDAFTRTAKTQYVAVMHEQAGGFAAEGYAKVSGRPGVAIATSGPGATNLLTPIANCYYDSVPAIFITGQVVSQFLRPDPSIRQIGFQECATVDMATPVTKYATLVTDPKSIRYVMEKAWFCALEGRPGPVLIDLPIDIQRAEIEPDELLGFDAKNMEPAYNHALIDSQIDQYMDDLSHAGRPVMLVGGGVRLADAVEEFRAVANALKIPCFPTWNALDVVTSEFPYYGGRVGTYGGAGRNFGIQNSDLLLAVGSRVSGRITGGNVHTFARAAKKYVVDVDRALLQPHFQEVPFDVNIYCDAKLFLRKLEARVANPDPEITGVVGSPFADWTKRVMEWKEKYDPVRKEFFTRKDVHPYAFMRTLSEMMGKDDVLVGDCGGNIVVLSHAFETKYGQRVLTNNGFSPMGFSFAGAMGAWFAKPKGRVICTIGDGGFNMNIQELQTLLNYDIGTKTFILNNHIYGITKAYQKTHFQGRMVACGPEGYKPPDFRKVVRAYGVKLITIDHPPEVRAKINEVLNYDGPVVCDVNTHDYQTYEPRIFGWKTPIEDMYPYLPREEFLSNMYIEPMEGWDNPVYPDVA